MIMHQYRKKIMAGFPGKAADGTLGQPWEGATGPLSLTIPARMIMNDDLDLQVVLAVRLASNWQGRIDRPWLENIISPFDEYGMSIRQYYDEKVRFDNTFGGKYELA
jgi:hypothetical protein